MVATTDREGNILRRARAYGECLMRFKVRMVALDGVIRRWEGQDGRIEPPMVCQNEQFDKLRLPLTCFRWQSPGKSPMSNGTGELRNSFRWPQVGQRRP
jgi:hypothetical protein